MHLSLKGVLRYGSAALLVTAAISLVILFREIAATRKAVEKLGSEGRESAAAFELGSNAIETTLSVVAYRDTGDPAQRARVEQNHRDFATWLGRYRLLADPPNLTQADRLEALHEELHALGVFLMAERDAGRDGLGVADASVTLAPPLPKFLQLGGTINVLIDEMQAEARADQALAERRVQAAHRSIQTVLVLASTALLLVLALLATSSVLFVSRPLRRLLAGTRAISSGNLSHRIRLEGRSELAIVGQAIDSMAESLQLSLVSRDKVTANSQRLTKINEELSAQIAQRIAAEAVQNTLQERLARAAAEWSWTFDSISDLVIVLDEAGRISRVNEAARLLARRDHAQCAGFQVREVFGELGAGIERLRRSALRELKPQTTAVRDADSSASWSLLVSPRIGEGASVGIVAVARDSSYMEELEAAVQRSQRMAEMGSFVAGVAHEVRNPLFGITANLDAMDLVLEPNSESLEFSHRIRGELGRLSELMRDLIDYARPSVTKMESWSIREVVDKALAATELYARDAAVMVECHIDPMLNETRMHPQRVRQALQNLIENAVIFSPKGSTIRVDVSPTVEGGAPSVTFAVSDAGPGFREEDVSQAVEPFFTRRRGGTGLGLSIVRRVAEDHGGRVTIGRSGEGGAKVTFSVSLEDGSDE